MTDDESDAMLDRLDRGEPAASKEEAAAREPYERLISRIRDLPNENPPEGWESRLEQRRNLQARRGNRRRRRWLVPSAVGAVVAAATALGIVLLCRPASETKDDMRVARSEARRNGELVHRGNDVIVGDTVKGRGTRIRPFTSVRIYRDMTLVAACPGHSICSSDEKNVEISLVTTEPGYYRIMVINGDRAPPTTTKGFELDRGELMRDGFAVEVDSLGDVRP